MFAARSLAVCIPLTLCLTVGAQEPPGSKRKASDKPAAVQQPVKNMAFNFRHAPWQMVLEVFAEAAGLTLDVHDMPTGTYTHIGRETFTTRRALDIVNGHLLREGYLTIENDGFLIVWAFDQGVPPSLVPEVSPQKLETDFADIDNQLLTVTFSVPDGDVARLAREVDVMLDPYNFVRIAALTGSGKLIVTDLAVNLRRVKRLVDAATGRTAIRRFELKHISSRSAGALLRSQFGLADQAAETAPAGAAATPQLRISADLRGNSLLIAGTQGQLEQVETVLAIMDVATVAPQPRQLVLYRLRGSDPEQTSRTIEAIRPGLIVTTDTQRKAIAAMATPAEHEELQKLIQALDGEGSGEVAVFHLGRMDPLNVASMIETLFRGDATGSPNIQADVRGRRLIVRGTVEQVAHVRSVLKQLGVDGTHSTRPTPRRGPILGLPLNGRNPEETMELLKELWQSPGANPIRVVVPGDSRPVIRTRPPATRDDQ